MKKTSEELQSELKKASKPLIDFIRKHYTPMATVIVTGVGAELLNSEINAPADSDWN
jgi:hypothetical protein